VSEYDNVKGLAYAFAEAHDPSARDDLFRLVARAAVFGASSVCWEHADNCCKDWCESCKDGAAFMAEAKAAAGEVSP